MELIRPVWPAPPRVVAFTTTRDGGASEGPYASLNLGTHVEDDPARVEVNRARLNDLLPAPPCWLEQVHGTTVARADTLSAPVAADAAWTDRPGTVCAVMTADCLPVLFCDRAGTRVAAAHAGWRGLADGVLEATVAELGDGELLAWLGPAIGPAAYEVGAEVREAFVGPDSATATAFTETRPGHWYMDLYALARRRLAQVGVDAVYGGDHCTFSEADRFFSYRRDGVTGRMASLIWVEPEG